MMVQGELLSLCWAIAKSVSRHAENEQQAVGASKRLISMLEKSRRVKAKLRLLFSYWGNQER